MAIASNKGRVVHPADADMRFGGERAHAEGSHSSVPLCAGLTEQWRREALGGPAREGGDMNAARRRARSLSESKRLSGQAGEIMQAARKLYETRGVAATTVKDIAAEAGITRELVYYYFANKRAITEAVLDDYIEDLVESAIVWNESRKFGDTLGSLRKCVAAMRRALYGVDGSPRPMARVLEELGVRDAFGVRAVRETVDCIDAHIVTEYAAYHKVEIEFVYETFCMLIFGLVGLMKLKPDISDETLMKLVEQTLRLDMVPLDESNRRDNESW